MPVYFDNQLTIVPVQPLKGRWFIRIDQFWVISCAALWGQTEAWLVVQSGMLSNAQAWLTAHQHAELNSLAKCFPFTLTQTLIKLWISSSGFFYCTFSSAFTSSDISRKSKQFLHKTQNMFHGKKTDRNISPGQLKIWITCHYINMLSYKSETITTVTQHWHDSNCCHAYLTTSMHTEGGKE